MFNQKTKTMKHTKGEWYTNSGQVIAQDSGKTLAIVPYFDKEDEEQQANTQLMAAAPQLLAALQRFQDEWVVNGNPDQRANNATIERQMRAAINEATYVEPKTKAA